MSLQSLTLSVSYRGKTSFILNPKSIISVYYEIKTYDEILLGVYKDPEIFVKTLRL